MQPMPTAEIKYFGRHPNDMIRDGVVRAVASLVRACRCGRGGQLRESPAG
jgi:hypothetical protein